MNISLIILSVFLKILPRLILLKKIKEIGNKLSLNIAFLFLGLFAIGLSLIRDIPQILAIFFLEEEATKFYLEIYFKYQIVYIIGIYLTFYIVNNFIFLRVIFLPLLYTNLNKLAKAVRNNIKLSYKNISLGFIILSIFSFILILIFSPAGLNWITNTRYAYMVGRMGIGPLWIVYVSSISLASFYLGSSTITYDLYYFRFKSFDYLIKLLIILFLAYLSGSKGIVLNILFSQFSFYLITARDAKISSMFSRLMKKLIIKKIFIYTLLLLIISFTTVIILLRGANLFKYITEISLLNNHITYTMGNSLSIGSPGELFINDLFITIPRYFRELFNLPPFSSSTIILEAIFNLENKAEFQINTPALDPVLSSVNIWGINLYLIAPLIGSFIRFMPIALLILIYNDKRSTHGYYGNFLLPIFAIVLNFIPLINRIVILNLLTFLP